MKKIESVPTAQHQRAAEAIVSFYARNPDIQAVLLVCSCARGRATPDSCLDISVLVLPEVWAAKRESLETAWHRFYQQEPVFQALLQVGKYSHVDLEFSDGRFEEPYHGWTTGPDEFELAIGNLLAYGVPLWEGGAYYRDLQARWLPYYDEPMRERRLAMVRGFCLNNLHHIPPYVARGLYFQSFNRLYDAFGEFLQALFIARRTYPIAYDKWIQEQVQELLGMPELYRKLVRLFEIRRFESEELLHKTRELEGLLEKHCAG